MESAEALDTGFKYGFLYLEKKRQLKSFIGQFFPTKMRLAVITNSIIVRSERRGDVMTGAPFLENDFVFPRTDSCTLGLFCR